MNESHRLGFDSWLCHSKAVTLGTSFNLSKPQVPHQYSGIYITSSSGLRQTLHEDARIDFYHSTWYILYVHLNESH